MKKLTTNNTAYKTASGKQRSAPAAARVLVVDDHQTARDSIAEVLRQAGLDVETAGGGPEALLAAEKNRFQCVVSDLQMPGIDGIELMRELRNRNDSVPFLLVTAHASVATAVAAIRLGAFDYIEKPFEIERLERLVFQAIRHSRTTESRADSVPLRSGPNGSELPVMIGNSPAMRELKKRIETVARVAETVLISGENGTGKEIVAKLIHAQSPRAGGAWVTLNCPALSPQLMESELFGHKKGAFTGADADRIGRFEFANDGTILLDEISEIDLSLQPKLLRVLQERSFERVGSSETVPSNARVLATTNRNLSEEIGRGRFREDLYYRLAVLPITVPPLRERREDIPELIEWFLREANEQPGKTPPRFEDGVFEILLNYDWPGNVRQLKNVITRASVFGENESVGTADMRRWLSIDQEAEPTGSRANRTAPFPETRIPKVVPATPNSEEVRVFSGKYSPEKGSFEIQKSELPQEIRREWAVGMSLEEIERQMIEATLEHYQGHRAKTARTLGIGVRTLLSKLRQYGYGPREKLKIDN